MSSAATAALRTSSAPAPVSLRLEYRRQTSSFLRRSSVSFADAAAWQAEEAVKREEPEIEVTPEVKALLTAAACGDLSTVKELMDVGKTQCDNDGNTALLQAAGAGQIEVVEWLLDNGATMLECNKNGNTALLFAAHRGRLDVLQWLVDRGASLKKQRNRFRNSALNLAAFNGHLVVVQWLLEHGASPNEKNSSGEDALMCAARNGNVECIEWLVNAGANMKALNNNEHTALHIAGRNGHIDAFHKLLAMGCQFHPKKLDGCNLLLQASRRKHTKIVQWLVENGTPISTKTPNGNTPLHLCCTVDDVKTAEYLVSTAGSSLKEKNKTGHTPLMVAALSGSLQVFKFLYPLSSHIKHKDKLGLTPILLATRNNHLELVKWMIKFLGPAALEEVEKTGNTPLLRAAKMGHLEIVEFLAENGGNIYESNSNGDTALVLAASPDPADNLHRKLEVVKWLVARGYDISEESLHIAQRTSTPKMTREVIHQALRRKKHVDGYLRNSSDGRKGDQGKALDYLRKAAKSGHPDAQLQLAQHLIGEGEGLRAIEWMKHAAFQGNATAAYGIGSILMNGRAGMEIDQQSALQWYMRAGALGHNKGVKACVRIAVQRESCEMLHEVLGNDALVERMKISDLFNDEFAALKMLMSVTNNQLRAAHPLPHRLVRELVKEASDSVEVVQVVGNIIEHGSFAIDRSKCLGGGAFGVVYRGVYNDQEVAVKEIDSTESGFNLKHLFREICVTNLVQHENVLEYVGFSQFGNLYFILTQLESRSLTDYLATETLTGPIRHHIALSIATGMLHLHAHSIAHRDLKTGNILIRDCETLGVRVADMGIARETHEAAVANAHKTKANGSVNYLAPEMIEAKEDINADENLMKADLYSFGYIVWSLYSQQEPHQGLNDIQIVRQIMNLKKNKAPVDIPRQCPKVTKKLLKKCFQSDPKKRPSFEEVIALLLSVDTL